MQKVIYGLRYVMMRLDCAALQRMPSGGVLPVDSRDAVIQAVIRLERQRKTACVSS